MRANRENAAWERRRRPPQRTSVDIADELPLSATVDDVFERLLDVDTVALCLPGLLPGSLRSEEADRVSASVRQTVLGVTATWQLQMTMRPQCSTRTLGLDLEGTESRLGMKLTGMANVAVEPASAETTMLRYSGHVEVEGRLAATGAPVIRRLVEETLRRFVEALGADPGAASPPTRPRLVRRVLSWLKARWQGRAGDS